MSVSKSDIVFSLIEMPTRMEFDTRKDLPQTSVAYYHSKLMDKFVALFAQLQAGGRGLPVTFYLPDEFYGQTEQDNEEHDFAKGFVNHTKLLRQVCSLIEMKGWIVTAKRTEMTSEYSSYDSKLMDPNASEGCRHWWCITIT